MSFLSSIKITLLESDELKLELKSLSGTPSEKENISIIFNMLSNNKKYWVISSLFSLIILFSLFCYICLDILITNKYQKIFFSFFLFIIFIDLIPRYIVKSYQLSLISKYSTLINLLIYISSPITFFLGKTYSCILGKESHDNFRMTKNDIKAFIELQRVIDINEENNVEMDAYHELKNNNETDKNSSSFSPAKDDICLNRKMSLNEEEVKIMCSVLDIRDKKAINVMIPIDQTYSIDYDGKFNNEKLREIINKGYSRIPVYSNHDEYDIIGLIRIKQLLGINFSENKTLCEYNIQVRKPLVVHPNMALVDLLKEFRKGKSHMAFITENVEKIQNTLGLNRNNSIIDMGNDYLAFRQRKLKCQKILGMVTIEDVIESMFNIDINDEDDYERQRKQSNDNCNVNRIKKNISKENMSTGVSPGGNKLNSKKNQENNIFNEELPYAFSPKMNEDIIL